MQGILIICLLLSFTIVKAQTAFTIYDTFSSDLPADKVNKIVIDGENNKWIGTESGLVKMNPAGEMTLFTTANSDIPGNQITAIFIDNDIVWIGTQLNGMAKFDGTTWTNYDPSNSSLPDYQVKCINKDSNDTLWIGTPSGLVKWDIVDYWFVYTNTNSLLHSNNINDIYIDAEDNLYIGTLNGGLSTYINGFIDYYRTDNSLISDNTILSIDEDIFNNKWLATSFGGLSVFTPDETFLKFTPLTSDIADWSIDAVTIDNDNIGLIGMSSTGLEVFDNVSWQNFTTTNSAMPDDYINTVMVDGDNKVWMGTDTGGVVVLDRTLLISVDDLNPIRANVYPNPVTSSCIITTNINEGVLQVYNLSGMLCLTQKIKSNTLFINVSDLVSGNYIIKITNSETSIGMPMLVAH